LRESAKTRCPTKTALNESEQEKQVSYALPLLDEDQ
jgi:hypothetical protein